MQKSETYGTHTSPGSPPWFGAQRFAQCRNPRMKRNKVAQRLSSNSL